MPSFDFIVSNENEKKLHVAMAELSLMTEVLQRDRTWVSFATPFPSQLEGSFIVSLISWPASRVLLAITALVRSLHRKDSFSILLKRNNCISHPLNNILQACLPAIYHHGNLP